MSKFIVRSLCVAALCGTAFIAQAAPPEALDASTHELAHDIFKQLIEINTTDSVGNVTTATKAMEQRLLAGGFSKDDIYVGGPNDRKQNLVVRYRGTGARQPILFIGHLDVVEAPRNEWHTDPFKFVEKDGYYYGRGTQDMKDADAIMVTNFIRLKQEGFKPDRDLILALTADEEGGKSNGVAWLLKNHLDLMKAGYSLNPDGGSVDLVHGKAVDVAVDATEKLYGDFQLTVTNPGGHSSLPVPDNAIYHLSGALVRLQNHAFPFELNEVARAYFKKLSTIERGQQRADLQAVLKPKPDPAAIARLSKDPEWNSMMHTTCVATRLDAGLANNALPQRAQAIVNCRILPGYTLEQIRQQLIKIFADSKVTVRYMDDAYNVYDTAPQRKQLPPAPLNREVMAAMDKVVGQMWPGAPVIPTMAPGASDSIYTMAAGIPSYGVSGVAIETNDDRAHARDERLQVDSFYRGVVFYYRLIKTLSGGA
ncbi:MAG: M20/M25/M40 family metallo-hydrolase [Rhodanobacter sp.]|jgi:acetylornithine deacetylase/succinyl-diaminopimelate desuccinylase-like protein|nr:M20/M25/M40 family metallo-hydrolase [Rhodanobacter sp.]